MTRRLEVAKIATNSDEEGVAASVMLPDRPKLLMLTVVVPEWPARIVMLAGWADIVKLPVTVKATIAERIIVPLLAVMVTL